MHNWLIDRNIKWIGIQSGDSETNSNGMRGFMVICILLNEIEHIIEFMLTWG